MINVNDILIALRDQLNNDASIQAILDKQRSSSVELGTYINMDPNRTPWIGVYKGDVIYEPRTLGYQNWKATPSLKVIAQTANLRSAEECETDLNNLIEIIVQAVTADITINGTVDMVNNFKVEYGYIETEQETLFYQSAIITFETEVDAS